jgi:hypothetical protein
MKKISLLYSFTILTFCSFAQQNLNYKNPNERFDLAKEYFQKGHYNLAYPILKELQQAIQRYPRLSKTKAGQNTMPSNTLT